ncbi:kinesin-like protein KIN-13A isoform X2 [Solanum stenotomum]|uniref:kinesin-like protein KIN-13A isoform X2 n=1 Tax=Solanum stenotomum TaxID=172797 RepID=UPI0020D04530|nr:kinesin-like protein KIN-13A isoform X2 [Solanum stenotomum]
MGGHTQQSNPAATAVYDHPGNAGPTGDAGDAVMARWLQSAGLQHLASPLASTGVDQRLLPNLLMQHVNSEPFEPSHFMPAVNYSFDRDFDAPTSQQQKPSPDTDAAAGFPPVDKENNARENNVAKIKVVVRKRPVNKKEIARKEDDIVTISDNASLIVHEPKLKVDLTAYVEKHEFCFDAVLDEHVTNDEVYRVTVQPIIPIIFQRTKATCFAYGQTGSGKTYTMQPLPLRAAEDLMRLLHQPVYRSQKFKLWLSFFEIYGGKLFDLLSDRKKLCMREDGRQQVCIVGLQEFEVSDVQIVKEYIVRGNAARSTGSTGANEESSRSHAILQLVVKKHNEVKDSKRNNDGNDSKGGKVIGKISFIDLAGSERGADTTDNDRQTRIEGAEINKSLLALKECIRALDNDQIHIPFRGSKLTEVLRDSFVGNSRTVMISCISPNAGSCEHTLNTLRYADRVKSLSKSGNTKKDQNAGRILPMMKEPSSAPTLVASTEAEDDSEQPQESKVSEVSRRMERESTSYNPSSERNQTSNFASTHTFTGWEESGTNSAGLERDKFEMKHSYRVPAGQKMYPTPNMQSSADTEDKVQKVSPPRRKVSRDEKPEKPERPGNGSRIDVSSADSLSTSYKQQSTNSSNIKSIGTRQNELNSPPRDDNINEILEEEEALITAHRKEIEDTMEIVREEMKLLAEVDQPGSLIDNYVTQLSFVLSRKAASLVSLQARLARFQHQLKEQEILSRKRGPR